MPRPRSARVDQEYEEFDNRADFEDLVNLSQPQPGQDVRPGLGNFPPHDEGLRLQQQRAQERQRQRVDARDDRRRFEEDRDDRRHRHLPPGDPRLQAPFNRQAFQQDDYRDEPFDDGEDLFDEEYDDPRQLGPGAGVRSGDRDYDPLGSDSPSANRLDELRQQLLDARAQYRAEVDSLRREVYQMRGGAPPQQQQQAAAAAQADPYADLQLPFQVNDQHVMAIRDGEPAQARQLLQDMFTAAMRHGARETTNVLTRAYQTVESSRAENAALVSRFWADHPELTQYEDIVQGQAQRIFTQYPHLPTADKMELVAQETSRRLRDWGLDPRENLQETGRGRRMPRQPVQRRRLRPAGLETDGGAPRRSSPLSSFEREAFQLLRPGEVGTLH